MVAAHDQLSRHVSENPRVADAIAPLLAWDDTAEMQIFGVKAGNSRLYSATPVTHINAEEALADMQKRKEEPTDGDDS